MGDSVPALQARCDGMGLQPRGTKILNCKRSTTCKFWLFSKKKDKFFTFFVIPFPGPWPTNKITSLKNKGPVECQKKLEVQHNSYRLCLFLFLFLFSITA